MELKLEFRDWHFLSKDEFQKTWYSKGISSHIECFGPSQRYDHQDNEYYYESENMVLGLYTITNDIIKTPNMTPEQFNALWLKTKATILQQHKYKRDIQLYDGGICGWNVLQVAWVTGNITLVKYILDLCGNDHNRKLLVNLRVNEKTLVDLFFNSDNKVKSFKKQFQLFDCVAPFYQKDRLRHKLWFEQYDYYINDKRWRAMLISSVVEPESIWYQIKYDSKNKTIWEPRLWLIIRKYM
jgi:hypothetical protein